MLGAAEGGDQLSPLSVTGELAEGQLEEADDAAWERFVQAFLQL